MNSVAKSVRVPLLALLCSGVLCAILPTISAAQSTVRGQTVSDSLGTVARSDSTAALEDIAHQEAFGVRLGVGFREGTSGVKPIFNPFYDVPVGNILLCAELMLTYESFSTLDFGTFRQFHFDAYGFALKAKSVLGTGNVDRPYFSLGPELSVLTDRVSIGWPMSVGVITPLTLNSELDVAADLTPLVYLGHNVGLFYGLTLGLRWIGE